MKNFKILPLLLFANLIPTFAASPQSSWISIQGQVSASNKLPLEDGFYPSCFRLFANKSGGDALWEECGNIKVSDGIYQTFLGDENTLPSFSQWTPFVEVEFNNEVQSPRLPLTGTPFAERSRVISDSVLAGAKLGEGVAVRSINGLRNDLSIASDSSLIVETQGDTVLLSLNPQLQTTLKSDVQTLQQNIIDLRKTASTTQSGLLSASDYTTFQNKGDMKSDSLRTVRLIPYTPADIRPTCNAQTEGLLMYSRALSSFSEGLFLVCKWMGTTQSYGWKSY